MRVMFMEKEWVVIMDKLKLAKKALLDQHTYPEEQVEQALKAVDTIIKNLIITNIWGNKTFSEAHRQSLVLELYDYSADLALDILRYGWGRNG